MTFQLLPLKLKAGIYREGTNYAASGTWFDCNKMRFRNGLPEKIGGWVKAFAASFLGTARALISWTILNGNIYLGIGTHLKYYVETGGTVTDITPIRLTVTLGNDPFGSTDTTTTVVVTHVAHGAIDGDFVTFSGATTFAGIPAGELNAEHQITLISANSYSITVTTPANATTSGGGAAVSAAYQINTGLDTTVFGTGWGAGTWGEGTWGTPRDTTVAGTALRLWSHDNFGEDLIINPRGGTLYYWDATSPSTRAVAVSSMVGASNVPTVVTEVLVSDTDRHVLAFGANPFGSATQDKLHIRWSDAENAVNWDESDTEGEAGSLSLGVGSQIITATHTKQELLVWTDISLHSMQYRGAPYIFGIDTVAYNISIIGPNAKCSINDTVYWMGFDGFYRYNGRVESLPCDVRDYVFSDINREQAAKTNAGSVVSFGEVIWFYCSADAQEVDRYVVYNYEQNIWYYGSLSRTAWLDRGVENYPRATASGYVYHHELSDDDGSTMPATPIEAYIESAPIELPMQTGSGSRFASINRMIPDVTFRDSPGEMPMVTITLTPRNQPGSALGTAVPSTETRSTTLVVEQFTEMNYVRLRGRSIIMRIASTGAGVAWRLGVPRLEVRSNGRR